VQGYLGVAGQSPEPRTPGWHGGIHTWELEAEGTVWSRSGYQSGNRDVGENFESDEQLERGDVVCLAATSDRIERSTLASNPLVIGIVSTPPAVHFGAGPELKKTGVYPVALGGRVPCKITDENGPIRSGDLLTSAAAPGHAMKSIATRATGRPIHTPGTILGGAARKVDQYAARKVIHLRAVHSTVF
jgi:hypothetical protein